MNCKDEALQERTELLFVIGSSIKNLVHSIKEENQDAF
jgi:hypothetical protein